MKTISLGPLTAHVVVPNKNASDTGPVVVLLHGFGAPGTDLVGLAGAIDAPAGTRFIFPEAPHLVDLGYPMMGGDPPRAWWPIDMLRLQVALQQGRMDELADQVPPGLLEARKLLESFLQALQQELEVSPDRLVLGGFSQGAMLSADLMLHTSLPYPALVQLSGTLLAQKEWQALIKGRAQKLRFFQSHGRQDPILPFSLAQRLYALLNEAGHQGEFVSFEGGHGIPTQVVAALGAFLRVAFPNSTAHK
jgi:phospholipase/carboxylesterase